MKRGLSINGARNIIHFLRESVTKYLENDYQNNRLGVEVIVEKIKNLRVEGKYPENVINKDDGQYLCSPAVDIDESLIGHFVEGLTRVNQQLWVLGMIDRATKYTKLFMLQNRSSETLINFIVNNVNTLAEYPQGFF